MATDLSKGVSFVIPVRNGESTLAEALDAILIECAGLPSEVLIVDDGSEDAPPDIAVTFVRHEAPGRRPGTSARLLSSQNRGAASAINVGIAEARYEFLAQVDQDVVMGRGWLSILLRALNEAPDVAAAQGTYELASGASVWARSMGLDLMERYSRIHRQHVNHVCTGNTLYRVEALRRVGLLDETFGYGYDNDLSYRLRKAGYRLAFCPTARSTHHWRSTLPEYARQQFGVAYGRLDVIAKHPSKVCGDDVSGLRMILHPPLLLVALGCAGVGAIEPWCLGRSGRLPLLLSLALMATLGLERTWAGISAWIRFKDPLSLFWFPIHLVRDGAWIWAMFRWCSSRLGARPLRSIDAMRA